MTKEREKKRNEKLLQMVEAEREKVAGYEQITKLYSAYISILLERLGATEDNAVNIGKTEAVEAMNRLEARAISTEDGYRLYCEIIKKE